MTKRKTVTVGIPTYQRVAQLETLLNSIHELSCPPGYCVEVLIANNESDNGKIRHLANSLKTGDNCINQVEIINVENQGISYVRNALLETAFVIHKVDFLAMVDDDETVDPRWLCELLSVQAALVVDVVGGKKNVSFAKPPEEWMLLCDLYTYLPQQHEGVCPRLVSTDNLLFTRKSFLEFDSQLFDTTFALTGGGDTEYLHRLKKLGAVFAFTPKAQTTEHVPLQRMSKEWAKKRAFRIGIGLARINIKHDSHLLIALHLIKLVAIMTSALLLTAFFIFSMDRRFYYWLIAYKQIGKVAGYLGSRVFPYATKNTQ